MSEPVAEGLPGGGPDTGGCGPSPPGGTFAVRVEGVVAAIAPGTVLTYAEVAAEAGTPGAARAVGRVLQAARQPLPWWRVVTASGRLVPGLEAEHARLLAADGVRCRGGFVRPWPP